MSFGYSTSEFVILAKFAWTIYNNIKDSRNDFKKLGIDVESLLVSIGSLDKGHTRQLIADYIASDTQHSTDQDGITRSDEVRALREGLNNVIMPFYALFMDLSPQYQSSDPFKQPKSFDKHGIDKSGSTTIDIRPHKDKPWKKWDIPVWTYKLKRVFGVPNSDLQELRSRFAVQATNLSLFMTRLTHMQLQQQTELLTLRITEVELLDQNWRYSHDLKDGRQKFREDVARYIYFLLRGGNAFTEDTLNDLLYEQNRKEKEEKEREERRRTDGDKLRESIFFKTDRRRQKFNGDSNKEKSDFDELDDDARRILERAILQLAMAEEEQGYAKRGETNSPFVSFAPGTSFGNSTNIPTADPRASDQNFTSDRAKRKPVPEPRIIIPPGIGATDFPEINTNRQARVDSSDSESPLSSPSPSLSRSPRPYTTRPKVQPSYSEPYIHYPPTSTNPYGMASPLSSPLPQNNSPAPSNSTINSNAPPPVISVPFSNTQRLSDANSHLQCNNCHTTLKLSQSFYRCSTGKCASKKGDSFDLCLACYGRGFRCRRYNVSVIGRDGRRKNGCGEMIIGKFAYLKT